MGRSTEVTVINVSDQQEVEGWTFGDLVNYFADEKRLKVVEQIRQQSFRDTESSQIRIINQVSFEFSDTPLAECVTSPQYVREIDWMKNAWPLQYQPPIINSTKRKRERDNIYYPLMQYYCITSSACAYMDFHIDVGGTSFWYHLVSGRKQFILIEPTHDNLVQYENWASSDSKALIFLPDLIKDKSTIIHLQVNEHETIIVPSGWIHSVYTQWDSLAFGGNFLHGYSTDMQNKINEMEIRSLVSDKFRCPYFNITNVFSTNMYLDKLQLIIAGEEKIDIISNRELEQLAFAVEYIVSEYIVVLKSKKNSSTVMHHLATICGNYNSVYDEPNFEDAVKYVLQHQKCDSLKEVLIKLYSSLAAVYNKRNLEDCYYDDSVIIDVNSRSNKWSV